MPVAASLSKIGILHIVSSVFLPATAMSLQTVSVTVCLFLAQVAADTGVHFVMERHPNSNFCGHLQCVADLNKLDHNVITLVEMAIYDITWVNSELKLASVSTFDPDVYVDATQSSAVSCTGFISRLQANLTLKLRHNIDCLYGVYKCQLDLITESGHPEVRTEIVIPENNHNYSRDAEDTCHIDKLAGLFNFQTTLVSNQTTVINNLGSHLVDITSQLMGQTEEINKQGSRLDNQTTKLTDQTVEINKLGSRLDDLTAQLINQTAQLHNMSIVVNKLGSHLVDITSQLMNKTDEINKQGSRFDNQTTKLTDQTAEIKKLGSRLDDLTVQLINKTSPCHISQGHDLETSKHNQQHDDVEQRLLALDLKLDTVQKLSNQIADTIQDQETCIKGQPRRSTTKRITVWGNTTALCDTITDGGGWIIIQKRSKGDVNFHKDWNEYKRGFGDLNTDFWIGNDVIHALSQEGYSELRIDMIFEEKRYYAHYSKFYVDSESNKYQITVGGYEGTAGDSLGPNNHMYFTTFDRDNDSHPSNYASVYKGAWWFRYCHQSQLNGQWGVQGRSGMIWYALTKWKSSVSFSEMKIRRG